MPTFEDIFDGSTDLVVGNEHKVIDIFLTNSEALFANEPDRGSLTKQTDLGQIDALVLAHTALHRISVKRLNTDDFHMWRGNSLQVCCCASQEATTAYTGKDDVELGWVDLSHDLGCRSALASNDIGIIKGWNVGEPLLFRKTGAFALGFVKVVAEEKDAATVALDSGPFDVRRVGGHDNGSLDAQLL